MTERERNRQFCEGLTSQGYLTTLLVDWAIGSNYHYDIIACCPGGLYWAIEGKRVEIPSWTSKQTLLGARSFKRDQIPGLLKVADRQGGRASVVLFVEPPRSAETRAWVFSARAIAQMIRKDRVLRLTDLGDPAADAYELARLPQQQWGLGEHMLKSHHSHGWTLPPALTAG